MVRNLSLKLSRSLSIKKNGKQTEHTTKKKKSRGYGLIQLTPSPFEMSTSVDNNEIGNGYAIVC